MGIDYRKVEKRRPKSWEPHPIWRGIGCALMVIIPIVSFGLADLLMPILRVNVPGFYVPAELRGTLQITEGWLVENYKAVIGFALLLSFLLYSILAVVYAIVNSLLARNLKKSKPKIVKPFIEE